MVCVILSIKNIFIISLICILSLTLIGLVSAEWSEVYMPLHYQETGYTCGPASLRMIGLSWDNDVSESAISSVAGTTNQGTTHDGLKNAASQFFGASYFENTWSQVQIGGSTKDNLLSGKRYIIHIMTGSLNKDAYGNQLWEGDYGHYITIKGFDPGQNLVRVNDPIKGTVDLNYNQLLTATSYIGQNSVLVFDMSRKTIILNPGDSIQNAIDSLSDGDIIYLNGGTYNESNINVNKRVTIKVSGVNGFPIIDAQGKGRVFTLSNGATLKDLVIAGGYSANGAGVYNDQGIISHCTLIYNTATGSGGGIFNYFGTVNDYSKIQDNYAIDGAGVLNLGGNVNVCTIAGNIATRNGGGVNSNGVVSNCFIAYNTALTGGGLFKSGGTVNGCSYTDNHPDDLYS
jgi:hypothetical protein